jgi:hypothetical protein
MAMVLALLAPIKRYLERFPESVVDLRQIVGEAAAGIGHPRRSL